MIDILKEAICDNKTGRASSTRIVMLLSGSTLCVSTVWLTVIVFWRVELVPVLTVFGGALATMSGAGYVAGRAWPGKETEK
jgi:hypothetical protein